MDNTFNQQLNNEIEKLKVGDYTSYQNFYAQTSGYLYQIISNNVQEQDAANQIMNDLYTEIYGSIGTELTDNSQFFDWAGSKAQTITDTYVMTHNIVTDSKSKDTIKNVAVAAATNAGMNVLDSAWDVAGAVAEDGAGQIGYGAVAGQGGQLGYGTAAGQGGQLGYGTAAGQGGQIGYRTAAGEGGQTGMDVVSGNLDRVRASNVANDAGVSGSVSNPEMNVYQNASGVTENGAAVNNATGNGVAGNNVTGNGAYGNSVAGKASGKTAMSIGTKVAIGIATAAVVIGGVIAIVTLVNKDKDKENKTEITEEVTVNIGEDGSEEAGDTTEAVTETNEADDTAERYAAYYEVVKQYMAENPTVISYEQFLASISGFSGIKLFDLNNTGKEQLILSSTEKGSCIYDYVNGELTLVGTLNYVLYYSKTDDGRIALITENEECEKGDKYGVYEYADGQMVQTHTFRKWIDDSVVGGPESDMPDEYKHYYVDEVETTKTEYDKMTSNVFEIDGYINGNIQDGLTWFEIMQAVREKHDIITSLAEVNQDNEFISVNTEMILDFKTNEKGWDMGINTSSNKYNETFSINVANTGEQPIVSADGKTVYKNEKVSGTGYYMLFDNDEVILVGVDTYTKFYVLNFEDYSDFNSKQMQSYAFLTDKEVSKEEFETSMNTYMSR